MPFDTTLSPAPAAGTIRALAEQTDRLSLIGRDAAPTVRWPSGEETKTDPHLHKNAQGKLVNDDGDVVDTKPTSFPSYGGNCDPEWKGANGQPAPALNRDEIRELDHLRDTAKDWRHARVTQAGRIRALHGKLTEPWPVGSIQGAATIQPGLGQWNDPDFGPWRMEAPCWS